MPGQLEQRIGQFTDWRNKLVTAIDEFRAWQDTYGAADIEQTLRIYDMVEGLRNDRIRLAFMGESAEDKVGLINALLFSDMPGGFSRLEKLHGEKLVPERQALLLSAVAKEIGPLVQSARQAVAWGRSTVRSWSGRP